MTWSTWVKGALPIAFIAGMLAVHCTTTTPITPGGGDDVPPGCDPDRGAPCTDDFFICEEDGAGGKRCEGQIPAVPDGGTWDCHEQGTTLVCDGDHIPPSDGGEWFCEENDDGSVTCRRHGYIPNDGGEGFWDCWYEEDNTRVCEATEGTMPDGDGDADADGDGDSDGDGDGDGDADCLCVPGAVRYCDTPAYCLWGHQVCEPDGMSWGPCEETTIPVECLGVDPWYSPSAALCCIASGYCCQDMWDSDHDGDTWESLGDCVDITCE